MGPCGAGGAQWHLGMGTGAGQRGQHQPCPMWGDTHGHGVPGWVTGRCRAGTCSWGHGAGVTTNQPPEPSARSAVATKAAGGVPGGSGRTGHHKGPTRGRPSTMVGTQGTGPWNQPLLTFPANISPHAAAAPATALVWGLQGPPAPQSGVAWGGGAHAGPGAICSWGGCMWEATWWGGGCPAPRVPATAEPGPPQPGPPRGGSGEEQPQAPRPFLQSHGRKPRANMASRRALPGHRHRAGEGAREPRGRGHADLPAETGLPVTDRHPPVWVPTGDGHPLILVPTRKRCWTAGWLRGPSLPATGLHHDFSFFLQFLAWRLAQSKHLRGC